MLVHADIKPLQNDQFEYHTSTEVPNILKQDLYIPLTSTDFLSLSDFLLSYILLGDRLSGSLLEELLVDPLFFGVAKINKCKLFETSNIGIH